MIGITIVITCYKEGNLIHRAVDSLKEQTDKDFLTILVYDASNDPVTESVCKFYKENSDISVIWNERNVGLSGSRNIAVEHSESEIIVFLDADDTLPKDSVKIIRKEFVRHPDADFIYGDYTLFNIDIDYRSYVSCAIITDKKGMLDANNLYLTWILLGTSPVKRELFIRNKGYSSQFSNTCQDVDFWMRALSMGAKGYYTNNSIYNWYRSDSGMNSSIENYNDLGICKAKNFDFFIKFHPDTRYVYKVLHEKKNISGIKNRAIIEIRKGNKNKRNRFYAFTPAVVLKLFSRYLIKSLPE